MLDLQHQYNNCTTTLHMVVSPIHWDPLSCEMLLCSCCIGVVQESNPIKKWYTKDVQVMCKNHFSKKEEATHKVNLVRIYTVQEKKKLPYEKKKCQIILFLPNLSFYLEFEETVRIYIYIYIYIKDIYIFFSYYFESFDVFLVVRIYHNDQFVMKSP
jgi:hypothetical protein